MKIEQSLRLYQAMRNLCFLFTLLLSQITCLPDSLLSPNPSSTKLCSPDESLALIQFRNSITSFNHTKLADWREGTDCCSWEGVVCDYMAVHVVSLELADKGLKGTIDSNSSLFLLRHLEYIQLSYNDFNNSPLPPKLAQLSNLIYLYLDHCNFAGEIPPELSHMSNLVRVDLSYNHNLRLKAETFERLVQNLTNLEDLHLQNVNMSLVPPSSFMNLSSSLNLLSLDDCGLRGKFPDNIFQRQSLGRLTISNNRELTGSFPKSNGSNYLWSLDISFTKFSVDLHDLVNLESLTDVNLSGCKLVGLDFSPLPNLSKISYLNLSGNGVSGHLPSIFLKLEQLSILDLSHNNFTGRILDGFNNLTELQHIDFSYNQLDGPIPSSIFPSSTFQLQFLLTIDLSSNMLTGHISSLICNLTELVILDLSDNRFTGMLPYCLGNLSQSVQLLDLSTNKFQGPIPQTFSFGGDLQYLNLKGNQLEGPLPKYAFNSSELKFLDLSNNKIEDTFPYWLETLPELRVLVLGSNKFHGSITGSKNSFSKLRIFDISNNNFSGPFPTNHIENLKAMMDVGQAGSDSQYMGGSRYSSDYTYSLIVTLKGSEVEMTRILNIFATVDLSINNFTGEVSESIGRLKLLKALNLSHNSLEGHIPSSLGKLINLESLDLSSNMFAGKIPVQLASLTFLEVLNLSCNQLVGPIPQGKQFNTFGNDSFSGNLELCGFPLSKLCSYSGQKQPPVPPTFEQDDDTNGIGWQPVLIGYGCGAILGLAMGYLVFQTRRPKCFLRMVEGEGHQRLKWSKKNATRIRRRRRT